MNAPNATPQREHDWHLSAEHINRFQNASIERLVRLCKHAHYTNVKVRINGEWQEFEADWIKHMAPSSAESETARRFTGVGELERTGYIPAGSAAERESSSLSAGASETASTSSLAEEYTRGRCDGFEAGMLRAEQICTDVERSLKLAGHKDQAFGAGDCVLNIRLKNAAPQATGEKANPCGRSEPDGAAPVVVSAGASTTLADDLRKTAAEADEMVAALNNGQRAWRMCIPVQHDDTDMIVARLVAAARKAADTLEKSALSATAATTDQETYEQKMKRMGLGECPITGRRSGWRSRSPSW